MGCILFGYFARYSKSIFVVNLQLRHPALTSTGLPTMPGSYEFSHASTTLLLSPHARDDMISSSKQDFSSYQTPRSSVIGSCARAWRLGDKHFAFSVRKTTSHHLRGKSHLYHHGGGKRPEFQAPNYLAIHPPSCSNKGLPSSHPTS